MSLDSTLALCRLAESNGLPHESFSVLRSYLVLACRRGDVEDLDAEMRTVVSAALVSVAQPLRAALKATAALPLAKPLGAPPGVGLGHGNVLLPISQTHAHPQPHVSGGAPPGSETASVAGEAEAAQLDSFRRSLLERLVTLKNQVVELASFFVSDAVAPETFVWAHKIKGDLHRYVAEATASEKEAAAAETSFAAALTKAQHYLTPTSALRLGAALNYASFLNDVLRDATRARRVVEDALAEAEGEIHSFDGPQNLPDAAYVMQLLRKFLAT